VLCDILFVLYTEIPWEFSPQELRSGAGMTAGGGCGTGMRPGVAAARGAAAMYRPDEPDHPDRDRAGIRMGAAGSL
jgi:hypothetical protein